MERMRERKQERIPKFLCKVLLGNFQIQFFFLGKQTKRERERERPVIEQRGGGEGSDYQRRVVVGDWMSDHRASTYRRRWDELRERERERIFLEFSFSLEDGWTKWKLVFKESEQRLYSKIGFLNFEIVICERERERLCSEGWNVWIPYRVKY